MKTTHGKVNYSKFRMILNGKVIYDYRRTDE